VRYVVFLRAINVGNRRIRMEELRAAYVDAGFSEVETHIASGNVIIDASTPPSREVVEQVVSKRFGFVSEAFIRSSEEAKSIVDRNPWPDPRALVEVSFLESRPRMIDARKLEATVTSPEALSVSHAEVFLLREGKGIPPTHKESTTERLLGSRTTRRGIATVQQIVERYLT
jgi:uncharacterized protein (DUF1697 family)